MVLDIWNYRISLFIKHIVKNNYIQNFMEEEKGKGKNAKQQPFLLRTGRT